MHGNKSTTPSGIDILELPLRRILLWKNANRGVIRSRCREMSPRDGNFSREGRFGEDGIRLAIVCTIPIAVTVQQRPRVASTRQSPRKRFA